MGRLEGQIGIALTPPPALPRVRELMSTSNLVTIGPDDHLGLAMQAILWSGVRDLPVVEARDGTVVGILGEREILARRAESGRRQADQLPVRSAMSALPVVLGPDDELTAAAAAMVASGADSLPVVDESVRLIGMLSTTDVLRHEARRALPAPRQDGLTAADVMTPRPLTVRPHENLLDAVALMTGQRVRHLPVTDGSGRLLGMLSDRDVRSAIGDPVGALHRPDEQDRVQNLDVAGAMSLDPVVAHVSEPLSNLVEKFLDQRIGAIAIVDADGQCVGIVSYLDVLRVFRRH